jgi:hypothetical protein
MGEVGGGRILYVLFRPDIQLVVAGICMYFSDPTIHFVKWFACVWKTSTLRRADNCSQLDLDRTLGRVDTGLHQLARLTVHATGA